MIKIITQNFWGTDIEMLYCDHCGEGVARQEDNNPDVKEFVYVHFECTKPKNNNLDFLVKAKPF